MSASRRIRRKPRTAAPPPIFEGSFDSRDEALYAVAAAAHDRDDLEPSALCGLVTASGERHRAALWTLAEARIFATLGGQSGFIDAIEGDVAPGTLRIVTDDGIRLEEIDGQ